MGYNSAEEQGQGEGMARKGGGERRTRVVTYGFSWKTRKRNKFCRINSIRGPANSSASLSYISPPFEYIYARRRFLHKLSRVCRGRSVARMLLSRQRKYLRAWGRRQSDTSSFYFALTPPSPLLRPFFFRYILFLSPVIFTSSSSSSCSSFFSYFTYSFFFIFASSISYFGRGILFEGGGGGGS